MPEGMTRAAHIRWCKERALQEMNFTGFPSDGIASMMSDLRKHPETNDETLQLLCVSMLMKGRQNLTKQQVIDFINGFAE